VSTASSLPESLIQLLYFFFFTTSVFGGSHQSSFSDSHQSVVPLSNQMTELAPKDAMQEL
jgi:hypothetical protein